MGAAYYLSFLRHAFGTHLYEDGVDLLTIKALLGHKSINSTTIYVHLASNGTSDAVSPLTSWEVGMRSKIQQIFDSDGILIHLLSSLL